MKYQSRSKRMIAGAILASAVTVGTGLVADAAPAAAAPVPVSLTVEHTCKFPMLGYKDVKTTINATVIDEVPDINAEEPASLIPVFDFETETLLGPDITEGLYTMNAATIEGAAEAFADVKLPDFPTTVRAAAQVAKTDVPESGSFKVKATGKTPQSFGSGMEGWTYIRIGNLKLSVTPRDKQGNATALGTLTAECFQKPGQDNVLAHIWMNDPAAGPEKTDPDDSANNWKYNPNSPTDGEFIKPPPERKTRDYPPHTHSLKLRYQCKFPFIGDSRITVNARLNYPESVPVDYDTPRIQITSINYTDEETTRGLMMLNRPPAATISGDALAWATIKAPEITGDKPLLARVKLPVPSSKVPTDWNAKNMEIEAKGSSVALLFAKAGEAEIRMGDLELDVTPRSSSGALTEMGQIKTTCAQEPGQDNRLARVRITDGIDSEAPGAPGAPAVTGAAAESITLKWAEAKDNVGIAEYEVYEGDKKVATTAGDVTTATIEDLSPNKTYTFRIKARDGSGHDSPFSPSTEARTINGPDTKTPSDPGTPEVTARTVNKLALSWPASSDNVGVAAYEVFQDGRKVQTVTGAKATISGLEPDTEYQFKVRAKDASGNTSGFSATGSGKTGRDTAKPTTPTALRSTGKTSRVVALSWRGSQDNDTVATYEIVQNGRVVRSIAGTSGVAVDLQANTTYKFQVRARDRSGNVSGPSNTITVKTSGTDGTLAVYQNPYSLYLDLIAPGPNQSAGLTMLPKQ